MEILNLDYNIGRIVLIALNTTPNKIESAKCLGITKRTLFNHIRRYDITVYSESCKKGYKSDSKLIKPETYYKRDQLTLNVLKSNNN